MSRSNKTDIINPADRFFKWSGSDGKVVFYDKETEQNVDVKMPFKFLVLDRVFQVGGGIDRNGAYSGFWSNAVRNLKTQEIVVRSKQGIEARGLYEDIKGTPGVQFLTGLYIAYYNESKEFSIGYFKLGGAALTAWIDFTKKHRDIYSGAISITGNNKCKKGTNTYFEPVFDYSATVPDDVDEAAIALDRELQTYLTAYFAQKGIEEVEAEYTGDTKAATAKAGIVTYGTPPELEKEYEERSKFAPPIDDSPTDDIPF